ncbi:MAG: hypothetical protein WEE64_10525 [Dehalococcoidia bacterium]
MDLIKLALAICVIAVAGQAVLLVPPLHRMRLSLAERLGLSLLLGMGAVALELLLLSLLEVDWALWQVAAVWPIALFALAGVHLARRRPGAPVPALASRATFAALLVAVIALGSALAALAQQEPGWRDFPDGFAFYVYQANAFYEDGSMKPYFEQASDYPDGAIATSQPDHPPLVPLTMTALALFLGEADGGALLVVSWVAGVGLTLTFFGLLRRLGQKDWVAGLFSSLLLLGFIAEPSGFSIPGYADLPLAAYFLVGGGYLYGWARDREPAALIVSALALGLGVLTKNEGTTFLLIAVALVAAFQWSGGRRLQDVLWPAAGYGALALVVALPWLYLRQSYDVDVAFLSEPGQDATAPSLVQDSALIVVWITAKTAQELYLPLIGVALGVALGWRPDRAALLLAALIVLQFAADALVVLISPDQPRELLRHASVRLVLQMTPLVFLLAAETLSPQLALALVRRGDAVPRQPESPQEAVPAS